MLQNFITDADLKKYHPNLKKQLWSGQASYQVQIDEAYRRLLDDLHNTGINPRLIMTPSTLRATVTDVATTTGESVSVSVQADDDRNLRRLVVVVTEVTGTWAIYLQGSNDSSTWAVVGSLAPELAGTHSLEFEPQYKYYRSVAEGTGSISHLDYIVETIFDRVIVSKAFAIIFTDFRKAGGDAWDLLRAEYERSYDNALASLKYTYDADDSGDITQGEEATSTQYLVV